MWNHGIPGSADVDPASYYGKIISGILDRPLPSGMRTPEPAAEWTKRAVIYNLFVRHSTAFDHNRDGNISTEPLPSGFRETGTLLKSIALLPYIQSLGANTVYLLPLTRIGRQNKKGQLGSPYAVRNPYELDPLLDEPALNLPVETQLQAFVEAAHLMNMRVVFEFVFRTASIDSDWIITHPEWFYWIRSGSNPDHEGSPDPEILRDREYGPPHFDRETLAAIYEKVDKHDFRDLPAPDEFYRHRFVPPPENISRMDSGYEGVTAEGQHCQVASAFSDWPPDDMQPPWTDVAYLKMHRHSGFNYIAYNTIRMYDEKLDQPDVINSTLWDEISGIIPWYQNTYAIDGAMMDMGHALPSALKASIVEKARKDREDFAFWDENFDPSPALLKEGFNAVFGSLPFVIHELQYVKGLLNFLNKTGVSLPFFATGENHNTPRVCYHYPGQEAGRNRSLFFFTLGAVLPALPFLHAGMEICEWHPVNLGLNFNDDDRRRYPPDKLPLFSPAGYDWETCNGLSPLNSYIKTIIGIRQRYIDLIQCGSKGSMIQPYISDPSLLAVLRKDEHRSLVFAGNSNIHEHVSGLMEFSAGNMALVDLISSKPLQIENNRLVLDFAPGQCYLFELPDMTGQVPSSENPPSQVIN
jgi:hypothetical protein